MFSICINFEKNAKISAPSWGEMVTKCKGLITKKKSKTTFEVVIQVAWASLSVNCVLDKIRAFDNQR